MSVAVYEEEIKFLKIKQEDVDLFSGGRTKFFPSFFCLFIDRRRIWNVLLLLLSAG